MNDWLKKIVSLPFLLIECLFLLTVSCSGDSKENIVPDNPVTYTNGFNYNPVTPNADSELTIIFKADVSSALYGYTGDVYLYAGIIVDGIWKFQPSSWTDNLSKYKMTKLDDNLWSISLSSSIRSWFGSGTTPVEKLGLIVRSADGSQKGIDNDTFITVTDSKYKGFIPSAIVEKNMPVGLQYGINYGSDKSSATLVLYDKDKNGNHKDYAYVVGDFNNWTLSNDTQSQMYRDNSAGCWWITISNLQASKEYAFQYYVGTEVDGAMRLADPYTEKILDPDNDGLIPTTTYGDPKAYSSGGIGIVSTFCISPSAYIWKNDSFTRVADEELVIYEILLRDFTSSGDLNGAMDKLDYLKALGVNAIELMPVQEFDGNDSWGYNTGFYFALDKAYGTKNMYKTFIDACHGKGIAVLFDVVYNQASSQCPLARMYWDSVNSRPSSTNPWFNVTTPHYYSFGNDFNHSSVLTREFVKRNIKFLLEEYHIDGFRFDFTKGFTQKTSIDDASVSAYDATRVSYLKEYYATVKAAKPNAVMICEHFCPSEETELAGDGLFFWRNMNNAFCQSGMGWQDDSAFTGLYEKIFHWVGYAESHDEERVAYKQKTWGNYGLKTSLDERIAMSQNNAAFLLMTPGPKLIWQFGELGYDYSIDYNGRTGKKPVKWDYYDDSTYKKLYTTYSNLLKLRNANDDLFETSVTCNMHASLNDWNQGRWMSVYDSAKGIVVVGNFMNLETEISVTFPTTGTWYSYPDGVELTVVQPTQLITLDKESSKIYTSFK